MNKFSKVLVVVVVNVANDMERSAEGSLVADPTYRSEANCANLEIFPPSSSSLLLLFFLFFPFFSELLDRLFFLFFDSSSDLMGASACLAFSRSSKYFVISSSNRDKSCL